MELPFFGPVYSGSASMDTPLANNSYYTLPWQVWQVHSHPPAFPVVTGSISNTPILEAGITPGSPGKPVLICPKCSGTSLNSIEIIRETLKLLTCLT